MLDIFVKNAFNSESFSLLVIKMSNLHPTSKPEDEEESESEDDDDEEEDEEKKSIMTFAFLKHQGCVNRVRVC